MNKRRTTLALVAIVAAICIFSLSFEVPQKSVFTGTVGFEVHVTMWHWRDGVLIDYSHHPGTLTNLGANWIEDQLGDSPGTDPAKWIAVSNDTSSPSSAWVVIPNEITTGGMGRAVGTYADEGVGQWNITKIFSPTETGSCQLTGLYWAVAGDYLLCADTFNLINYQNEDAIQICWTITVIGS